MTLTEWAKMAGDLAGRIEQVRAWADKHLEGKGHANARLCEILDGKVIGIDEEKKTPADRLADIIEKVLGRYHIEHGSEIQNAIDEYRSTRNGIGQTTAATFGSPPDPVLIARFLLDSLTGGALSSLICQVRDEVITVVPPLKWYVVENLQSNLRALGEKLS